MTSDVAEHGLLPSNVALLHVATVPAPIRNFYIPYAEYFRSQGWRVDAAARGCTAVDSVREAFDNTYELPLSRSLRDARSLIRGIGAVRDLIAAAGPDIVHVHTPIASFLTRLAARRIPVERRPTIVYTAHGFHFYRGGNPAANLAFLAAERVAGRWTDRLVVINDEDEAAARVWRLAPAEYIIRMPGVGIDTAHYARRLILPERIAEVRDRLGIPGEVPLFASIGELHPNKRHDRTIEALARMRRDDGHLAIAGDGRLLPRLRATATRMGVADRVHFLGFVHDVRPLLAAATASILSSGREGLARSIMEALALGTPVIASDARGNRELVGTDGGFIVPNAAPAGLALAMDRLATDHALARAIADRAPRRISARYDYRRVLDMHVHLYAELLDRRAESLGVIDRAPAL